MHALLGPPPLLAVLAVAGDEAFHDGRDETRRRKWSCKPGQLRVDDRIITYFPHQGPGNLKGDLDRFFFR